MSSGTRSKDTVLTAQHGLVSGRGPTPAPSPSPGPVAARSDLEPLTMNFTFRSPLLCSEPSLHLSCSSPKIVAQVRGDPHSGCPQAQEVPPPSELDPCLVGLCCPSRAAWDRAQNGGLAGGGHMRRTVREGPGAGWPWWPLGQRRRSGRAVWSAGPLSTGPWAPRSWAPTVLAWPPGPEVRPPLSHPAASCFLHILGWAVASAAVSGVLLSPAADGSSCLHLGPHSPVPARPTPSLPQFLLLRSPCVALTPPIPLITEDPGTGGDSGRALEASPSAQGFLSSPSWPGASVLWSQLRPQLRGDRRASPGGAGGWLRRELVSLQVSLLHSGGGGGGVARAGHTGESGRTGSWLLWTLRA